ncbi:MmgE/PrpD family protein [Chloroflexota bacterium]
MSTSLSRQLAQFIVKLKYLDLPPKIVDKAKALTLQALASALVGSQFPGPKQTIHMLKEEETIARGGSTIMVYGVKVTKAGAAFANSELISAAGKSDSYRMLTHPSLTILPGALAVIEESGSTGKEFITAIVAAYEVMERLSKDFVPAVAARGFHPGSVSGIFGAAIAAGKLMNLNEDQMNSAIALCADLAGGNLEGGMHGGRTIHQNGAARNATLAVPLAKSGINCAETVLEGNAGFYHAYTGNNKGKLTYSYGRKTTSFDKITARLGSEWEMMNTINKIYSTSGTNIGPITSS